MKLTNVKTTLLQISSEISSNFLTKQNNSKIGTNKIIEHNKQKKNKQNSK